MTTSRLFEAVGSEHLIHRWRLARTTEHIERFMRDGGDLDSVDEKIIKGRGFADQEEAALWLYALSWVPPDRQRTEALLLLSLVP